MSKFNYTNLHFFDKHGIELPIAFNSNCIAEIVNEYGDNAVFNGMKDASTGLIEFVKKSSGNRFTKKSKQECHLTVGGTTYKTEITLPDDVYKEVTSTAGTEYYIDSISLDNILTNETIDAQIAALPFPTITVTSALSIAPVSVDLVETQSIYILCEDRDGNFEKLSEHDTADCIDFKDHYKLLFYINTKNQEDFRFFKVDSSALVWTDRVIVDFNRGDFKINIGFTAKEEGLYQEALYICLLKDFDESDSTSGEIFPIGAIDLQAEAIGEDERYRTLFANFGIPDPIHYQDIFANTSLEEGKMDYVKLNENSKKLFLTYDEIFSYVGTYKALVNAIKVLGYDDVFFKEWYKEVGKTAPGQGYVAYDMYYKADPNANTINNVPIEERISLKKLNWLSMIYRINKELVDSAEDQWGFPQIIEVYDYNDEEIITKLYSLRKWLEKYIIGLNCKIIDVSGEGIYFERYKLDSFGSYQQIYDWNNKKNLIPTVVLADDELGEPETYYLIDSSAHIKVNIGLYNSGTFEEFKNYTLDDFCEGYIDSNKIYHQNLQSLPEDTSTCIFTGKTFACLNDFEMYELKATSYGEDFLFGDDYVTEDSAKLRVHENKIFFNPFDLLEKEQTSVFKLLPFIQLERANIRKKDTNWNNSVKYRINPDLKDGTLESYVIKNLETTESASSVDYITLIPPTYIDDSSIITVTSFSGTEVYLEPYYVPEFKPESEDGVCLLEVERNAKSYGLRYSAINRMHMPMFSIIGYEIDGAPGFMDVEDEYYLEILDGKMLFDDVENDRKIFLNFNYDNETGEQEIKICIVYTSEEFRIDSYQDKKEISAFIPGNSYPVFYENYSNDPDTAINYYNIHTIEVKNSGKFTVDVYAKDLQNNIFAKNCENFAYVYLPDFSLSTYTNSPESGLTHDIIGEEVNNSDFDFLFANYQDFCIYNNVYMIDGFKKFVDDDNRYMSINYPTYSYSMHNAKGGDYLHFMNIADRYIVDAIEYNTNSTLDNTYTGYFITLEKDGFNYYSRVIEEQDNRALLSIANQYANTSEADVMSASQYMNKLNIAKQESGVDYIDVNFILYNELGNYPIMQTYATMINANAIPYTADLSDDLKYTDGKYRLMIGEYSERSYIWASLREHIAQDLPKMINHYIDIEDAGSFEPVIEESDEPVNDEEVIVEPLRDYYSISTYPSVFDRIVKNLMEKVKDASIMISSGEVEEEILEYLLEPYKQSLEDIMYAYDASTIAGFTDPQDLRDYFDGSAGSMELVFEDTATNLFIDTRAEVCLANEDILDPLLERYLEYMICQPEGYDEFIDASVEDEIDYILGREEGGMGLYADSSLYNEIYEDQQTLSSLLSDAQLDEKIVNGILYSVIEASKVFGNDLEAMQHKIIEYLYNNFDKIGSTSAPLVELEEYNGSLSNAYQVLYTCDASLYNVRERARMIIRKAFVEHIIPDEDITALSEYFINQYNKYLFATCAYVAISTLYNLQDFITYTDSEINNLYAELLGAWRNDVTIASYFNTIKVATGLYNSFFYDEGALDINSALIEEYDYKDAESEYKLYDKMLYNLTDLTGKFLKDKWVTKEGLDGDILYAVAAKLVKKKEDTPSEDEDEDEQAYIDIYAGIEEIPDGYSLYYVKPKGNSYEGLSYTNPVDIEHHSGTPIDSAKVQNVLPNITELVKKSYISAYVQPTWRAQVSISLITPENAVRLGFIDNITEYSEIENKYLCIIFTSSDFTWHFRKGEMIKLMFESLTNNEYIGQSSYEVVGYDSEEQVIIVKGAINAAYVRKEKHEVWAKLPLDKIPADDANALAKYTKSDYEERDVEPLVRKYTNEEIGIKDQPYRLPVKKIDGVWYYKVYYFVNGLPRAIETVKIDPQEKVNMYISYAHNAFVDYTMRATTSEENPNGTTDLQIDYNLLNCRKMQFVDDTFVMYAKNFDINEGLAAWMNSSIIDGSVYGNILNEDVYKYVSENGFVPVEISSKLPNVAFVANFEDMGLDFDESYVQWKIYRKLDTDNDRVFMFESYNKILYLDYTLPGIYDIEANVYDRYGNTLTKMFKGAYKVVD